VDGRGQRVLHREREVERGGVVLAVLAEDARVVVHRVVHRPLARLQRVERHERVVTLRVHGARVAHGRFDRDLDLGRQARIVVVARDGLRRQQPELAVGGRLVLVRWRAALERRAAHRPWRQRGLDQVVQNDSEDQLLRLVARAVLGVVLEEPLGAERVVDLGGGRVEVAQLAVVVHEVDARLDVEVLLVVVERAGRRRRARLRGGQLRLADAREVVAVRAAYNGGAAEVELDARRRWR
jgi:hypothetical protein